MKKKKDLALDAGISISTITKTGKYGAVVSSDVLVKICFALGCSKDEIVKSIPKKYHRKIDIKLLFSVLQDILLGANNEIIHNFN